MAMALVVVGVMVTFVVAPGAAGSACPERTGHACQYGGEDSGNARAGSPAQQSPRLKPAASIGRDGQPVWRAGNHFMN